MLVNHIVEPLLVFGAFMAVAAISTWIIVAVAKKYGTDEKNDELLDSVRDVHDQAENILRKTGSYMQQTEDLADDMHRKRIEKKTAKKKGLDPFLDVALLYGGPLPYPEYFAK